MYILLTHLGFWLRSAQNCTKSTFLDNLKTITLEGSMENFGLFWSVKYFNFEQKLPIRTAHYIFLESRHRDY